MSKTLAEIRVEIDEIDNKVHDLLMRRASLVSSVAAAKKKDGMQIVQPAREAKMIRRLLARHSGVLPKKTLLRIWRELVGSVALMQSGYSVHVSDTGAQTNLWDMAKEYFGSSVPMSKTQGSDNVFVQVQQKEHESFGVLPWPEMQEESPWWRNLMTMQAQGDRVSIICALPLGPAKQEDVERALIVSKVEFLPSDHDISFIGVSLKEGMSRSALIDLAKEAGFNIVQLYQGSISNIDSTVFYLFEVNGYFTDENEEVNALRQALIDRANYCSVVGGYPVVPDMTYN